MYDCDGSLIIDEEEEDIIKTIWCVKVDLSQKTIVVSVFYRSWYQRSFLHAAACTQIYHNILFHSDKAIMFYYEFILPRFPKRPWEAFLMKIIQLIARIENKRAPKKCISTLNQCEQPYKGPESLVYGTIHCFTWSLLGEMALCIHCASMKRAFESGITK